MRDVQIFKVPRAAAFLHACTALCHFCVLGAVIPATILSTATQCTLKHRRAIAHESRTIELKALKLLQATGAKAALAGMRRDLLGSARSALDMRSLAARRRLMAAAVASDKAEMAGVELAASCCSNLDRFNVHRKMARWRQGLACFRV